MNQEFLEALVHDMQPVALSGMPEEETSQAEELFVVILHHTLDVIIAVPVQQKEAIARLAAANLADRIAAVPPQDRLDYLVKEKLAQDIRLLDSQAFDTARRMLIHPDQTEDLIPRAASILEELDRIQEKITFIWPDQPERFGRILSEARLDCHFVIGASSIISLRLGRLLRSRKISQE